MPDLEFSLPSAISVLGTVASDAAKSQCGRWRTDAAEIVVAEGRFKASACSLHLLVMIEGPCRSSPDGGRTHRVLLPAQLLRAPTVDSDLEFRVSPTGVTMAFHADRKRVVVESPLLTGSLPPTDVLANLAQASRRGRGSTFRVPPRTLARIVKIASVVCPGSAIQLALGGDGRLRFDAKAGGLNLTAALQTPPAGDSGSGDGL